MADDPSRPAARPVRRRFLQLLAALERCGARYALCGAVAMGAHGVRRFSEDIDVLVEEGDLESLLAALRRAFREVAREPAGARPAQVKLRARRARGPGAVDIDLLVPVDAAESWALESAVRGRTFGQRVDVVSLEALVVLKLRAACSEPESPAGAKHWADVLALVRQTPVDVAALRRFLASDPALSAALERALAAPAPKGRSR